MNLRSPIVRHSDGWGSVRVVGSWIAAAALVGLLAPSSASALTAPRTVALHVTVNGSGTVRVRGNPAFTCRAHFPTSSHCRHTFYVRKGRRIVLKESPASGWKLWRWTGACHGSASSCSLRVKARRFGFVTASFVPPGDRLNPYPLGTTATLSGSWQMKVNSATLNADAAVEAVNNQPPASDGCSVHARQRLDDLRGRRVAQPPGLSPVRSVDRRGGQRGLQRLWLPTATTRPQL